MNSPVSLVLPNNFLSLLKKVQKDYPHTKFEEADRFYWSGDNNIIYYYPYTENAAWSLLHEIGHMINGDRNYQSDFELTKMEVLAWEAAKNIAPKYLDKAIDLDYIEDCLDSYRKWQHERSLCPTCKQSGLEESYTNYKCINCGNTWQVSENRFCRVYRKKTSPL